MSTCNRLDLQTLGSQPVMPKNLPGHWSRARSLVCEAAPGSSNCIADVSSDVGPAEPTWQAPCQIGGSELALVGSNPTDPPPHVTKASNPSSDVCENDSYWTAERGTRQKNVGLDMCLILGGLVSLSIYWVKTICFELQFRNERTSLTKPIWT